MQETEEEREQRRDRADREEARKTSNKKQSGTKDDLAIPDYVIRDFDQDEESDAGVLDRDN